MHHRSQIMTDKQAQIITDKLEEIANAIHELTESIALSSKVSLCKSSLCDEIHENTKAIYNSKESIEDNLSTILCTEVARICNALNGLISK